MNEASFKHQRNFLCMYIQVQVYKYIQYTSVDSSLLRLMTFAVVKGPDYVKVHNLYKKSNLDEYGMEIPMRYQSIWHIKVK